MGLFDNSGSTMWEVFVDGRRAGYVAAYDQETALDTAKKLHGHKSNNIRVAYGWSVKMSTSY